MQIIAGDTAFFYPGSGCLHVMGVNYGNDPESGHSIASDLSVLGAQPSWKAIGQISASRSASRE